MSACQETTKDKISKTYLNVFIFGDKIWNGLENLDTGFLAKYEIVRLGLETI